MSDSSARRGPWRRLLAGTLVVSVAAVLVWLFAFGSSGYARLAERVGQQQAERLLLAVIPMALAKHCHDSYGDDEAMVRAVAEFIVRNQAAIVGMREGTGGVDSMSDGEKQDLEDEALRRAAELAASDAACDQAATRMAAGDFDL